MPESNKPKTVEEYKRAGIIKMGSDPSFAYERIHTGIAQLDELLGGGIPQGRCVINFGPESTGKTLIAQYVTAAVQRSNRPDALYIDLEKSYDEAWWGQSGVDTTKLMVSTPTTAEEAINIMRGVVLSMPDTLGIIIVDSIAALIPQVEMDEAKGSEDNRQPGAQAKVVTYMYHQLVGILGDTILWGCNQMRESIGAASELSSLPGGRAQRHYSHIILKTRRESWIMHPTDPRQRLGYYMEITSMKNKTCGTADGTYIKLPIMFASQLDWTTSYIEDGLRLNFITRRGPYYRFNDAQFMGMQNLRNFFTTNPEQLEALRVAVEAHSEA